MHGYSMLYVYYICMYKCVHVHAAIATLYIELVELTITRYVAIYQ